MAARVLLPGFGGQYTSETFSAVSTNSIGSDTLDCSHVESLALQIQKGGGTGAGTLTIQETFDHLSYVTRAALSLTTDGVVTYLDTTDKPFGKMRISATVTAGTGGVTFTGFPTQTPW